MTGAAGAGLAYGAAAFALGFVFGALRVLFVAPALGPVGAVLVELPLMLGLLWPLCRWLVERWRIADRAWPRIAMGATAFACLLAAEYALAILGFGQSLSEVIAGLTRPEGLLGLAGQIGFAAFPWLQIRRPA